MTKSQSIQDLYAAFGRGDVASIVRQVSDDVDWNNDRVVTRDLPWNRNFSGKARLPEFFKAVGDELELSVFNPHTFIESGNHVAVLLHIEGRVKKNGRPLQNDAVHIWTFNDRGQVSAYRHYNDTAMEQAAWGAT